MPSNDQIRQRVQCNYAAFITDVDPDRLSDFLKQEGILSIAQWQDICGKSTSPQGRCRALLDFLLSGTNPRAFVVVRNVLEKDNHHLLRAIDDDGNVCVTEDKNKIKSLQVRLQKAEGEIDRLRKTVDELKTDRDMYHMEEEVRKIKANFKYNRFSDAKDRETTLRSLIGKTKKFVAERHPSAMYLTEDSDDNDNPTNMTTENDKKKKKSSHRRFFSVVDIPTAEPCSSEQKRSSIKTLSTSASSEPHSATLRPKDKKLPLGSKQYEKTDYRADPFLIKEIKTRASTDNSKAIHGLAILDAELFIISRVSSDIEVHDTQLLAFVRLVGLKTLDVPWDIVSCKINKCLYIMKWREDQSKTIVRIDPKGNIIREWSTGKSCGRLSVTQDTNIILAAYKTDTLLEYTAEGCLVREIKLPYTIAHPQHAIKLGNGNLIVIHGMYDDFLQRVCLLDGTGAGSVLASYGGEKGQDKEHLHGPIYLAVDTSGSIFVAEYANSRVILLSQSLHLKRVLLSKEKHGIRDPWSINLDEANGRLFLVDNDYQENEKLVKDGRVLVFQINSLQVAC